MKKVLVTGSNGLLGQKITDLLLQNNEVELIASGIGDNRHNETKNYIYEKLDVCDKENIESVVLKYKPQAIIHTAAMTNVDQCEKEKENCRKQNVEAAQYLAEVCQKYNIHLVHLSTDFIFDGENGPYTEEDEANPVSFYGQSKLDAEKVIIASGCSYAILRTIVVYGVVNQMSRSNIVLWAKSALEKGAPINVVNDQWRMPTLAEDLAMACWLAVEKQAQGVFNICGKDYMCITEMVERIADFWHLDKSLINPVSSTTLNQPARRPPKTGFDLSKSRRELGYEPRSFEEGLAVVDKQLKAQL